MNGLIMTSLLTGQSTLQKTRSYTPKNLHGPVVKRAEMMKDVELECIKRRFQRELNYEMYLGINVDGWVSLSPQ